MLHNPTAEAVEFMVDGVVYIIDSKQSRIVLGEVAHQVLTNQNTPLVEAEIQAVVPEPVVLEPVEAPVDDYSTMTYAELRSIASARKIFKAGMKHEELVKLLNA